VILEKKILTISENFKKEIICIYNGFFAFMNEIVGFLKNYEKKSQED